MRKQKATGYRYRKLNIKLHFAKLHYKFECTFYYYTNVQVYYFHLINSEYKASHFTRYICSISVIFDTVTKALGNIIFITFTDKQHLSSVRFRTRPVRSCD